MNETGTNKKVIDNSVTKIINGYLVDYFYLIVIYVVLVVIAFGYFYVLNPKYKSIKKNNELYQLHKKNEINQLNGVITNYNNYKNTYNSLDVESRDKINSFLSGKDDSEELLIYVRNMLNRGGYKLLSVNVGSLASAKDGVQGSNSTIRKNNSNSVVTDTNRGTSTDELGKIDISLKVGNLNYASLKNFLYFVERDARFFDIENINFSLIEGTAELKLKTYYLNNL